MKPDQENSFLSIAKKHFLLLPCVAGLVLSLCLYHLDSASYDMMSIDDQGLFQRIAINLLENASFSGSTGNEKPFCPVRPPLYSMILALIMKISGKDWLTLLRIIQLFSHIVTIWMIGRISLYLTGSRFSALLSSIIFALLPHTAALTHVVLTESLTIFLLVICMFMTTKIRSGEQIHLHLVIALAIVMGLLILMRPTFLFFPLFILLAILPQLRLYKYSVAYILVFFLFLALVLLPWSVTNYKVGHKFTPLRLAGTGFNVMAGIVKSTPVLHKDIEAIAMQMNKNEKKKKINEFLTEGDHRVRLNEQGNFSSEAKETLAASFLTYADAWKINPPAATDIIAADRVLRYAANSWIQHHPWEYIAVMKNNLVVLLFGEYQPFVYHRLTGSAFIFANSMRGALYLLSLTGLIAAFIKKRGQMTILPFMVIIYLIIIHIPMHTEPRYFVEAYPFMALAVPYLLTK